MLVRTLKVLDIYGTLLVPAVDGPFGQIDKPRPGRVGQCRGQIIGLYPIISFCGLNDRVVDLDEFLWVAGDVIFVNVPNLELFWPNDLPEQCR
jgi:hypothetical protein